MKLSSDAADNRILYEGITNYTPLLGFDTKSIQGLHAICIKTIPAIAADNANNIAAEPEVSGANISSISVRRLLIGQWILIMCITTMFCQASKLTGMRM